MLSGYHAIKLRSEFYLFYTAREMKDSDTAEYNNRHLYCISVLKKCYKLLQNWMKEAQQNQNTNNDENVDSIQNIPADKPDERSHFDVLKCLGDIEDLCETNEETSTEESILNNQFLKGTTIAEIDSRVGDLRVSALCLFYDMITMMRKVKGVWEEVKTYEKSILTAVSVTMVAYHEVEKLMGAFQKKYPVICTADEYYNCCLCTNLTDEEHELIQNLPIAQEQLHVHKALKFSCYTQIQRVCDSHPRHDEFDNLIAGKTYKDYEKFFLIELRWLILNTSMNSEGEDDEYQRTCAIWARAFEPLVMHNTVTIPTIFLCQCWFESVYILQDQERKCLGRQLYYLRSTTYRIAERIQIVEKVLNKLNSATKNSGTSNAFSEEHGLNDLVYGEATDVKQTRFWWTLLKKYVENVPDGLIGGYSGHYNNPIVCGCVTLDYLLLYHKFCILMQSNSDIGLQINLIALLYQKFQSDGYLQANEIPVLESLFQAFPMVAYVHSKKPMMGEYLKQYILMRKCCQPHEIDTYIADMYRSEGLYQYLPRSLTKLWTANLGNREHDSDIQALVEMTAVEEILWLQDIEKIDTKEKDKLLGNAIKLFEKAFHEDKENDLSYPILSLDLLYYIEQINNFLHSVVSLIPDYQHIYQQVYAGYQPLDVVQGSEKWNKINHIFAIDRTIGAFLISTFDVKEGKDCRIVIPTNLYQQIVELMKMYFPSIYDDSFAIEVENAKEQSKESMISLREYDFYLIPKHIDVWMRSEFGSITRSELFERSTQEECYEAYLDVIEYIQDLEQEVMKHNERQKCNDTNKIVKKAIHQELYAKHCRYFSMTIKDETLLEQKEFVKLMIKKYTISHAVLMYNEQEEKEDCFQTILHHILFGVWQGDRQFAEWTFQMWAYANLFIDCLPAKEARYTYTFLHLAAIHQYDWLGDILLCEGGVYQPCFLNQTSRSDGNTTLHYAVITGNKHLCACLCTAKCNLMIQNDQSCVPIEMELDEQDQTNHELVKKVSEAKVFVQRMITVTKSRTSQELKNVQNQLLSNFDAIESAKEVEWKNVKIAVEAQEKLVLSAAAGIAAGKKMNQKKKKNKGDNQLNPGELKKCTEEDIRRANQMEQELLRMLEEEESIHVQKGMKKKGNKPVENKKKR